MKLVSLSLNYLILGGRMDTSSKQVVTMMLSQSTLTLCCQMKRESGISLQTKVA